MYWLLWFYATNYIFATLNKMGLDVLLLKFWYWAQMKRSQFWGKSKIRIGWKAKSCCGREKNWVKKQGKFKIAEGNEICLSTIPLWVKNGSIGCLVACVDRVHLQVVKKPSTIPHIFIGKLDPFSKHFPHFGAFL